MLNVIRSSAAALLLGAFALPSLTADDTFAKAWPIIENSCVKCHGPEKQKSKLRLDSREAWLKGGENGKIVEPGDPEKSSVVKGIKWQHENEDYNMPPKKKDQLKAEDVAVIEAWIKAGMPWGK